MLLRAVQLEVQARGKEFVLTKDLYALTYNLSLWLTDDSHYFGFMMCGLFGNGKTTVIKALKGSSRNPGAFVKIEDFKC